MPFSPNSLSCQKKLSSEYQLYACGNFFRHSSILEKIAILGQLPRNQQLAAKPQFYLTSYRYTCLPQARSASKITLLSGQYQSQIKNRKKG